MRERAKIAIAAALVLLLAASVTFAQELADVAQEPDDIAGADFDDAAYENEYIHSGMAGSLWMPEFTDLNEALVGAEYAPLMRGTWLFGQSALWGSRNGVRVGFSTLNGATVCRGETDRRARLATSLYLFLLETQVAEEADGDVALGVALGGADSTLTLIDHSPESFDDALITPSRAELRHWSYIVEPALIAEHSPIPGLDLRLRIGLLFALGNRWSSGDASFRVSMDAFSGPRVALSVQLNTYMLLGDLDLLISEEEEPTLEP